MEPVMSSRECGDCKLCCKLLSIVEISKQPNEWCPNCDLKGATGCRIYEDRPKSCGTFECYWLKGYIPENFKPSKIKAVIWYQDNTDLGPLMMIAEAYKGQHRSHRHLSAFVEYVLDRGQMIVVLHPDNSRSILGNSDHHQEVSDKVVKECVKNDVSYKLEDF